MRPENCGYCVPCAEDRFDECETFPKKSKELDLHVIKSCPFCGHQPDVDDGDTLYPSGIYWRVTDGITHYIRLKDRKEGDQQCWQIVCNESSGGCDVEIEANTKEEAIQKWNRRT